MYNKSNTLSKTQLQQLGKLFGPTCTILTAGAAKLYTKLAEEYSFKYSRIFGVLCLLYDRSQKQMQVKLIHPGSGEVLFKMKIRRTLLGCYKDLNPYFMFFNYKNMSVGFSFSETEDVQDFKQAIDQYTQQIIENPQVEKGSGTLKMLTCEVVNDIAPNPDGLTLDFRLTTQDLRQKLSSLGIRVADYSDVNASMNTLNSMVEVKRDIRVFEQPLTSGRDAEGVDTRTDPSENQTKQR